MAIHDFKSPRLFGDHPLVDNQTFEASREQANYLLNVLRLETGSQLLVFNGVDGEWQVQLEALGRKKCNLTPVKQARTQPPPALLTYCFAPLKQARLDYMVQKAVEMGVSVLQPVITERTQVRTVNAKRMRSNAIEAAEQCGILNLPIIHEPIPLVQLNAHLASGTKLVLCDEDAPQNENLRNLTALTGTPMALLIGPEGGFSDKERSQLDQDLSPIRLGLGPRILRADTAAVAALAILQAHAGDWYKHDTP